MNAAIPSFARRHLPALLCAAVFITGRMGAGTPGAASANQPPAGNTTLSKDANWLTGENVNLGGILFPHIHFNTAYGGSSTDPADLAVGHHDPDRQGWTIQNVEFGLSGRFNENFEAFTSYAAKVDTENHWIGEFEEWFGKIKELPGGFELRGGRYYNRFGIQNTLHPHGFDWADHYLVDGRFLGEDSLTSIGGEVTWNLPALWRSLISVSVGVPPPAEEEEEEKQGGNEPVFHADGAAFDRAFVVANWTNLYDYNDFHQFRAGLNGAWGDNKWGRTTQVYGTHLDYQWRENGYEAGGQHFRWRTEAMVRSFDAVSGPLPGEPEEHLAGQRPAPRRDGSFNEFGMHTSFLYGLDCGLEFGLRGEYVGGIAAAGLDERFRVSPGVTCYFNKARTLSVRLQYNYDHGNDFGDQHSIWTQVNYAFGGPEVR